MKNLIHKNVLIYALLLAFVSCKKKNADLVVQQNQPEDISRIASLCTAKSGETVSNINANAASETIALPYEVSLIQRKSNNDGTYTWIWKISNPKPGDGNNGTIQDLRSWGISLGPCSTINDIVKAETSTDGINWLPFTPSNKEDKSQDCYTQPVLKFDMGTSGSQKTYYRLILNKNYTMEKVDAVYNSGTNTRCGTFKICGIGCL